MSTMLAHKIASALHRNTERMYTNQFCAKEHRLDAVNHKQEEVCNLGAHQLLADQ